MTPAARTRRIRSGCRVHALKRSVERGIPLGLCGLRRLETDLEKMRPAYERPGVDRYEIVVRRGGLRFGVVYDTHLGCLVTIFPIGLARHRPPRAEQEAA